MCFCPIRGVLLRLLTHSTEQAAVLKTNKKNVSSYCSGYGGDAIASYHLHKQFIHILEFLLLSLEM